MSIINRYILKQLIRISSLSLLGFVSLFILFDFFDRIDNLVEAKASFLTSIQYFIFKVPLTTALMLPVSILVGTLFTYGMLARSSELTAMRAAGLPLRSLVRPLIIVGFAASLLTLSLNELIVPYANRKVREIYNLDVKQKHKTGTYNQSNFWWRSNDRFISVDTFDSVRNFLVGLSILDLDKNFRVNQRIDSLEANFIDEIAGWSMKNVEQFTFLQSDNSKIEKRSFRTLPLPITQPPKAFYDVKADRHSMNFSELRKFIRRQNRNGISVNSYLPDLYEKLAFPFAALLAPLLAFPFALKPARTGSMASSIMAGLVIGFSYYAIHYFSLALGRAELWPALLSAWTANILMLLVATILNLGAEEPM